MSRELTKYVRPKDKNPEVEKIMEQMGCSEPVARNMLKMRKFGMGPLAGQPTGSTGELIWRASSPPRLGSTGSGMAADRRRKMQETEDEQREKEQEAGNFFEAAFERPKAKKPSGSLGIARLGPVMSRQETIDPLEIKTVTEDKVQGAREEAERRQKETEEIARRAALERRQQQEKAEEEARRRKKRKPKRKRRGAEVDAAFEGESGEDAASSDGGKGAKEGGDGSDDEGKAGGGASSSSGLMTEAEVLARMGSGKKKGERGSWRTAARVQKELQEWEQVKARDPEYNKAPKFALCFSAETGRKRKY